MTSLAVTQLSGRTLPGRSFAVPSLSIPCGLAERAFGSFRVDWAEKTEGVILRVNLPFKNAHWVLAHVKQSMRSENTWTQIGDHCRTALQEHAIAHLQLQLIARSAPEQPATCGLRAAGCAIAINITHRPAAASTSSRCKMEGRDRQGLGVYEYMYSTRRRYTRGMQGIVGRALASFRKFITSRTLNPLSRRRPTGN